MKNIRRMAVLVIIAAGTLIGFMQREVSAYRISDMVLRDANGVPIAAGSKTPYSPKQTCGTIGCHVDMVRSFGLTSGNIYESEVAAATKDHGSGSAPYAVPYPLHGVSAGYHFQTGRNAPWGQVQRDFYRDPFFTSSPGVYGNYCPSSNRRLAAPAETDASGFDMSSYDFAHAECAWCHAGGGPLEYDREGYRYDGTQGLFQTGPNPTPEWGDYYRFDPAANGIVSSVPEWQSNGIAEADCLMCHLNTDGIRYGLLERNFALSESRSPGLAASLGLAGASGTTGYLAIARKGGDGVNPDISPANWSWTNTSLDHAVLTSPRKENCALCHYADKGFPAKGPAGTPLGFTAFQKILSAGTAEDGDRVSGGTNIVDWKGGKPRADSAARGGSINDPRNPDLHMDRANNPMQCTTCHYILGTPRDYSTDCQFCHYEMWGYPAPPPVTPVTPTPFSALTDLLGTVIQPFVEVLRIDHQFAKGDSVPTSKDMDQLDNTVTCAGCHIDRTHPNAGSAPGIGVHNGIPRFHFDKIGCKTCHIPVLNGPVDQDLADFTAGPYQTFERTQTTEAPATGINRRPLYLWRATNHGKGPVQIEPFDILSAATWANATSQAGDGALEVEPAFPRTATQAAEKLRVFSGDADGDGLYDWTLNRPQGGDTTLIVNTPSEIADFIQQIGTISGAPPNPVMHFSFSQFSVSHSLRPRLETVNPILGSQAGGGCVMCHSSSSPVSPYYSPRSVGFFDKTYELFKQPVDGGSGLVQTVLPAAPPLSGNLARVTVKFPYRQADGTPAVVNLSNSNGQTVGNSVDQGEVLGYDAARLASLMSPKSSTYPITASAGPGGAIAPSGTVSVNAGKDQYFSIMPNTGYHIADVLVDGASADAVNSYTFTFVVAPHTIQAAFAANPSFTITASAGPNGAISPSGDTAVLGGGSQTFTITPNPGYRVADVVVDGVSAGPKTTYAFVNVTSNHTIQAFFTPDVFTITSVAYGGGNVTPSGTVTVPRGGSQTYTITPNPGYAISFVLVDGVNKGAITSHAFTNVTANHTIKAYFKLL